MWLHVFVILSCCYVKVHNVFYPIVDLNKVYNYSPPEDEITFHLYHFSDLSQDDQLFIDDEESLRKSRFNPDLPIKVIIHGWTHGKDVPWVKEMREAMAVTGQWNIIVVDWAPLSHVIYIEARLHTPVVSKQIAKMLMTLKKYKGTSMSSVHMIGHSMGAQIAGYSSLKVREGINDKVGRITGLDPAAPLYEWPHVESLDELLDPSDASFVDVIHTNGRHLGMITPAGHVDFYPNGGEHQPGCGFCQYGDDSRYIKKINPLPIHRMTLAKMTAACVKIHFPKTDKTFGIQILTVIGRTPTHSETRICSHLRSCEFWTASIKNPHLFKAHSYISWDEHLDGNTKNLESYPMGIAAGPEIPPGTYFLEVDDSFKKYLSTTTTIEDSLL